MQNLVPFLSPCLRILASQGWESMKGGCGSTSHLQVVSHRLHQCKPALVNAVGSSDRRRWLSHQTTLTQNFPSHPAVTARNAGAALCVPPLSKAAAFLSCNHLGQSGLEQLGADWISSAVDSKASWLRFKSRRHR